MIKLIFTLLFLPYIVTPVSALEISVPSVPASGYPIMPENTDSFGESLLELFQNAIRLLQPTLSDTAEVIIQLLTAVILISILQTVSGHIKKIADMAGTVAISGILLLSTNSMIRLAKETIRELSDYGKLLYPVLMTALSAQGGIATSASLYIGTSIFDTIIGSLISTLLIPMINLLLALAVANGAVGEELLKKICISVKNTINWCLKTLLMIFTTYMSITRVISGTTDTAALKATKLTISSVVPVVGGILSEASESILVSAGLIKNAAGIYGILAILAVFVGPFLRIGMQYLLLKATGIICGIFASKNMTGLIEDFTNALGVLLAITGSMCLLLLISTVCFMKGVG